jgi:dihydrofolate reductase
MRTIAAFLVASADGYYTGPQGEFDWPTVDEDFVAFANDQLRRSDTLVFGRATYEMMAAYWPADEADDDDPVTADLMNRTSKIVVSASMAAAGTEPAWTPTRVVGSAADLAPLRAQDGPDVLVLGSSVLAATLIEAGLLDELRIMVMPVLLGAGRSLLHTPAGRRVALDLLSTRSFDNGNQLLTYRPRTAA